MCPRPPIQCPSSSWPITVNVGTFVLSVRQQRVHVSPGLARTRLRGRRLQAPPMLQRCACALQAAGHGDSCAGSGRRRSGAPGASITKYTRGSVFIVPFPPLSVVVCNSHAVFPGTIHDAFFVLLLVSPYRNEHPTVTHAPTRPCCRPARCRPAARPGCSAVDGAYYSWHYLYLYCTIVFSRLVLATTVLSLHTRE